MNEIPTTSIIEIIEQHTYGWPGACSLYLEITDFSGTCGRCGFSVEDHEYLNYYELTETYQSTGDDDE